MKLPLLITAALLTGTPGGDAALAQQVIPAPAYDEAIIVPAGSPVRFRGFTEGGAVAKFTGRFVLTGHFYYGCDFGCEADPGSDADLSLMVIPDPPSLARLPHWKRHTNPVSVFIDHQVPLGRIVASKEEQRALRSGKLDHLEGHISIIVEDFTAALDCDSADYSATYVRMAAPMGTTKVATNSVAC